LKKSLPKFLTLEESKQLLEHASVDSPSSLRDYCIITLFLNCGMRLSELVGMNLSDINLNEKKIRILGKGNKERMIYLNDACVDALKKYIDSRENSIIDPKAVFISKKGTRISRRRVEQIVEQMLRQSGLSGKGISVHKLRHTAATLLYQYGDVDTLTLKEILGHKSIATTEIYTHLSNDILKKAAESSPLADFKKENKAEEEE
ncbi:MAG: tyrosine-type recombinase/integrase, partial [Porcipelethomonas sp.]